VDSLPECNERDFIDLGSATLAPRATREHRFGNRARRAALEENAFPYAPQCRRRFAKPQQKVDVGALGQAAQIDDNIRSATWSAEMNGSAAPLGSCAAANEKPPKRMYADPP